MWQVERNQVNNNRGEGEREEKEMKGKARTQRGDAEERFCRTGRGLCRVDRDVLYVA